jgi:hypothetical protein
VDKGWDALPDALRHVFGLHGIAPRHWEAIRQAGFRGINGTTYVTPDRLAELPDEVIDGLIDPDLLTAGDARLGRLRAEARLDLELTLRRYFADEVSFGQIREASRALTLQGSRPGTPVGEALRFLMHFKGFPFAFSQRVIGRAVQGHPGATLSERLLHGAGHIGHLIAGLTVAGYVSLTMKDMVKGWEPRVPHDFKSLSKIMGAAIVQGGGAGIMGDFLFGEANRFGGGALSTIAGPEIGTITDLFDIWNRTREGDFKAADAFRLVWGNLPFVNMFYIRPAVDYLFLNALYESLSPGYLRRQERNRRRDYGQERLWEPMP